MQPAQKNQQQRDQQAASWFARHLGRTGAGSVQVVHLALFFCALVAMLTMLIYVTWESGELTLKAGQIADRTIKAPRTATFESELKTQELRQEAYDDARNIVLAADPAVAPNQLNALRQALTAIDTVRADRTQSAAAASDRIRASVEGLSADDAAAIYALTPQAWDEVKAESQRLLEAVFVEQVRPEDVAGTKAGLFPRASLMLPASERSLAAALARPFVRANVQVDEERTKAAREAAAAAVEPVLVTVQQGEVIVRDGDPVTKYTIEQLEYFNLLRPSATWQQFAGIVGLLALLTAMLVLYLYRVPSDSFRGRQLLLIGMVVILPVLTGRFILPQPELRYMLPTAAAIMLLVILLDLQLAVVVAGFVALYVGIVAGNSYELAMVTFVGSLAGALVIWRAERTVTFLWAGIAVASATAVGAALFALFGSRLDMGAAGTIIAAAAVNGALSASLTFLSFSLLGRVFGVTTHLQLLELAHPNQPLLYRLAREAPGTYHHSIVVSNLAESAVEVIGGDPLFARVAVLYHDIGKVLRPSFFVENQANRANVHEALDPRTSARIIQEHVLDGIRLARKAHLPQPIIDIIEQHHGTSLIRYFYTQAVNAGEDVDESEFRYPGPKPQTKEAAVIMLADGVEAAVRSVAQSGRLYEESNGATDGSRRGVKLEDVVDGVIRDRLDDGQLDECDLTLKQIEQVRQTFLSILEGIYHPRVEYPELRRAHTQPAPEALPAEVKS